MDLINKFQIDGQEQAERKSFVRITEGDIELLRSLSPTIERNVDSIVDQFYEHMLAFDEPKTFFIAEPTLQRAKAAQREYLLDLFQGNYDDAYIERRLQIGVVHERIGLSAKWYLGGNAVFFQMIVALLARKYRFRANTLSKCILALNKVMTLDQELVMDTYIGTVVEKVKELADQILQSIQVLAPSAQEAAEMSRVTLESSKASLRIAEDGATTVNEMLGGMLALKDRVEAIVKEARQLSERIDQVGTVVKMLDEFTTDINVLALNAAVQAARAGEESSGFAVIADQIRKLADESKESLARIQSLIAEIHEATRDTLTASEAGVERVEEGSQLTTKMGKAFGLLANSAKETAASVQQITENVQEQSEAIAQLKGIADGRERGR